MTTSASHRYCIRASALIAASLLCLTAFASFAASTLVIEGVEGELENNIRLLVSTPPEKQDDRKFRRYVDGLPEQVVSAMSAYGYYSAQATVSVAEIEAPLPKSTAGELADTVTGNKNDTIELAEGDTTITQVTINVVRNEPVRIRNIELQIENLSDEDSDFKDVVTQARQNLRTGKVFRSSDYESAKSSLLNTAQQLGYFDFEFTRTQVRVSRKANTADIALSASAGNRYTFGSILFKQQTFSESFMNRWTPFEPGDPYQASLIGELTQNLQSSGYFSSVRVRPLVDPRYGETVPITVDLTQQDENQVAIGIGYSTDTEFRTKLTWGRPLLNSRGHSAEWGIQVSRYKQNASFSYRIPREKQPLFNFWGIDAGVQNESDLNSFKSTLAFQRVRRTEKQWSESIFLRWEQERFERNDVKEKTDLVMPGISYSRNRSRGEPFPTWGQSVSFQLLGGSEDVLSSINILKSVARVRYLRAVSDKHIIIGTAQYGFVKSNDNERVPTSQLFFAGGDRTVRGFPFRSLSPRDDDGEAIGGRFLEVLNLEYNYRINERWSGALFSDAGRAFDDYTTGYSVGAGFGIRWQSPVGPFRIDIATPISDNDGGDVRIHLSLGPDL